MADKHFLDLNYAALVKLSPEDCSPQRPGGQWLRDLESEGPAFEWIVRPRRVWFEMATFYYCKSAFYALNLFI